MLWIQIRSVTDFIEKMSPSHFFFKLLADWQNSSFKSMNY